MSGTAARFWARVIRASILVDRLFARFDHTRSRIVVRAASDAALDAYNDLAFGAQQVYDAGSAAFRSGLSNWEVEMLRRVMPPPPATILVGGAGGGREAFALAEAGYRVVAFEPSRALAASMARRSADGPWRVEAWVGRYELLPRVEAIDGGAGGDLSVMAPFDAAILGWVSYPHVRTRASRVAVLEAFARLTAGPIVLSVYPRPGGQPSAGRNRLVRIADALGFRSDGDHFTPHVGFYHVSGEAEVTGEVHAAGLRVIQSSWDVTDGRWPWLAAARADIGTPAP